MTFKINKTKDNLNFFVTLKDKNGSILFKGETFKTEKECLDLIEEVKTEIPNAKVR